MSAWSAAFAITAVANPTRTWDFELPAAGTYKIQVEHAVQAEPGTKVSYAITIGDETRVREFELVANRPFIPLVTDVPAPKRMRVAVMGLSEATLKETRVYAYNADYVPYWQYFDPIKDSLRDIEARAT